MLGDIRATSFPRIGPVTGAVAAFALAAMGETMARGTTGAPAAIPLYLGAAVLWAATAERSSIGARLRPTPLARRDMIVLVSGIVAAVMLDTIAIVILHGNEQSSKAAWPWLAGLAVLVTVSVASGRRQGWTPAWCGASRPTLRFRSTWLPFSTIVAVAAIARLVRLDRVPLGINADEGDRAALSLQIVHGVSTPGIFESGWYRISMVYFWTLAQVMRLAGTSYADARLLGALAGVVSVAVVTWIGIRHFNRPVGFIAGGLMALLGVALQFSRETTEAGPTAMLWTISMAFLLEGVRSGQVAAWIGAGTTGGLALYFYPSGRAWALFALAFFAYLLARRPGVRPVQLLPRMAVCLLASLIAMGPFLYYGTRHPDVLYKRGTETTVLDRTNAQRLGYYHASWSMPRLLGEQTVRSIGILDHFPDEGGFWPTGRPVLTPPLALLVILGLGWAMLRWRDPRYVLLALWFLVGLSGVVFTVETPNLQRMATAVPALTLFAALILVELRSRLRDASARLDARRGRMSRRLAGLAITGLAVWAGAGEASFYFRDYSRLDAWVQPNGQGRAVAEQGGATLVITVGTSYHRVNDGWVRLLAQGVPRGGLQAPGSDLPLGLRALSNLAFMVFPQQLAYLPYLQRVYPGGTVRRYSTASEGLMFAIYRLPRARWAAAEGARVWLPDGRSELVPTLGQAPSDWFRYPAKMGWSAGLRAPTYGSYTFRATGRSVTLRIDGVRVITPGGAGSIRIATVVLAAGVHQIELRTTLSEPQQPTLEWTGAPAASNTSSLQLQPIATADLDPRRAKPEGLLGQIAVSGQPEERRLDGTLANCCLADQVGGTVRPVRARWSGTLQAPVTGSYRMTLLSQGRLELMIDGKLVLRSATDADSLGEAAVRLSRGPHAVQVTYRMRAGAGAVEWSWTPPGGRTSIVPPSALTPPRGSVVEPNRRNVKVGLPPYRPLTTVP